MEKKNNVIPINKQSTKSKETAYIDELIEKSKQDNGGDGSITFRRDSRIYEVCILSTEELMEIKKNFIKSDDNNDENYFSWEIRGNFFEEDIDEGEHYLD
jgi:hypothetical protein